MLIAGLLFEIVVGAVRTVCIRTSPAPSAGVDCVVSFAVEYEDFETVFTKLADNCPGELGGVSKGGATED